MYPILIVAALGLAVGAERWFFIRKTSAKTNKRWGQLVPMLKARDYERAEKLTAQVDTPLAVMLNYGFASRQSSATREKIESAMEEGMLEVMPDLEHRTHYLATFANIATLLGLLGTIVGLIQAFTAVSTAEPAEKAELLSASISVAMNTTAFGLVVAIPLILIHSYLSARISRVIDNLEMVVTKCVNLMAH
jgi:biopolymer transport protein ExbB